MSDAGGILVSLAVSIVANFITFFALERFDTGAPTPAIRVDTVVTIEHTRIRGAVKFESGEASAFERRTVQVIRETTFVVESRRRSVAHLAISVAVGFISLIVLLLVLVI